MARNQRTYDNEYKTQAVKLAQEIGGAKAAKELGISWNAVLSGRCTVCFRFLQCDVDFYGTWIDYNGTV